MERFGHSGRNGTELTTLVETHVFKHMVWSGQSSFLSFDFGSTCSPCLYEKQKNKIKNCSYFHAQKTTKKQVHDQPSIKKNHQR